MNKSLGIITLGVSITAAAIWLFLSLTHPIAETGNAPKLTGAQLVASKGCLACHSLNGQPGLGPTFAKLYGKTETLQDGSTVIADEIYIKESIRNPAAKIVRGYQPTMPAIPLTDEELQTLVAYLKTLQ